MLKYIKHHLDTITDVEIYPIISLLLFFTVFITMLIHVLKLPKNKIEKISNLPLEEDENQEQL
ncbi:MAG: CcoQ/FixQ family Cbb3-type cytochrome c oxidase assembly chaperone [Flavobacteriales bacterium]|nr:MAG: CcoQ/FixQ family Cbb3-type cytochrome c oxidase assembly chaperone [Flavobacteriales bacterium]